MYLQVNSAHRQSLITHSNGLGILGAVLQAAAVRFALHSGGPIEAKDFVEKVATVAAQAEGIEDDHKE